MNFPARDFTNQFISKSYQDVLQQYLLSPTYYVLDGLGNVVFSFPSSSYGFTLITSDITSSMTVLSSSYAISSSIASNSTSASYALTASFSSIINVYQQSSSFASSSLSASYALTASFALNAGGTSGTSLNTGSTYPITASWAQTASVVITASYALTASYITGSAYGLVPSASFAFSASTAIMGITSSFANSASTAIMGITSSFAFSASTAIMGITSSFALTASYLNSFPAHTASWAVSSSYAYTASQVNNTFDNSQPIQLKNYIAGNLTLDIGPSYSDAFSVQFLPNNCAYVNLTLHNFLTNTGSADFYGEYQLIKDGPRGVDQPGYIFKQRNGGAIKIYSQIYDPGPNVTTQSLTIQLRTDNAIISSSTLTYEVRGQFLTAPTSSSPAVMTPASFPGLLAWWRADSLSLADTTPVGSTYILQDLSGNGFNATQSNASNQPLFFMNGMGTALPSIHFTGSGPNYLLFPTMSISQSANFTIIIIAKCTTDSLYLTYTHANNQFRRGRGGGNVISKFFQSSNFDDTSNFFANNISQSVMATWERSGSASSIIFWENSSSNRVSSDAGSFILNSIGGGAGFNDLNGDIAEICIYTSSLTTLSSTAISDLYNNYFKARWNL